MSAFRSAICCLCLLGLSVGPLAAQMSVGSGTTLTVDEGTDLRVSTPLTITVPAGATVVNNGRIDLGPGTELSEAPGAAITGTGTEHTDRTFTAPLLATDPGGLGARITTNTLLGLTSIERGHVPFTDYSGHPSIARWIRVVPATNMGLNATLAFHYDDSELNGIPENAQVLHVHAHDDVWDFRAGPVDAAANTITITITGQDSLGLYTAFNGDLPNAIAPAAPHDLLPWLAMDATGVLLMVPADQHIGSLELFDAAGRLLQRTQVDLTGGVHLLPTAGLPPGCYRVRLDQGLTLAFLLP